MLIDVGLELRGKDGNEWFIYEFYIVPPGYIAIAKRYFCWRIKPPKSFVILGHTIDSTEEPTLIGENKYELLLKVFKEKRKEGVLEVSIAFGLWYPSLYIIPYEKREVFEKIAIEKLGETAYYYSSIISYDKFLEILEETMNN